jgi:hypothetical protein
LNNLTPAARPGFLFGGKLSTVEKIAVSSLRAKRSNLVFKQIAGIEIASPRPKVGVRKDGPVVFQQALCG